MTIRQQISTEDYALKVVLVEMAVKWKLKIRLEHAAKSVNLLNLTLQRYQQNTIERVNQGKYFEPNIQLNLYKNEISYSAKYREESLQLKI